MSQEDIKTMWDKQAVLEIIRSLPEDTSLDEIIEEIQVLAAIQRGLEDAEQGRVVSHEEVRRRFEAWRTRSNGPDAPSLTSKESSTT